MIVLDQPHQISAMRGICCKMAIKTHLKFNGRMMLTRTATPARLRAIASEFTGKPYARSRKGLEKAYADLLEIFPDPPQGA
jgi:hypothetical protein